MRLLGSPVQPYLLLALPGDTYSSPQDLRISLLRWSEVFTKKLNRVIAYISSFFMLLHRLVYVLFIFPCQCSIHISLSMPLFVFPSPLHSNTFDITCFSFVSVVRPFRPTWSLFDPCNSFRSQVCSPIWKSISTVLSCKNFPCS